ncbi:MAG: hypothetical protein ACD_11C00018G0040 [uncultured bacterium]|nr:MAG: hypothetical protein ACD_11C00018G0040 [uncultured bacterium]HBR71565.1 hypothetical protein [Candidatus Moranbacteria bacterium]
MKTGLHIKISSLLLLVFFLFFPSSKSAASDYDLHQKYEQYKEYEKYSNYQKYKDYLEYKEKYAFESAKERAEYKDAYDKYRQYKKSPSRFPQYAQLKDEYKKYTKYKENYLPNKKYKDYKKYKKYNDKQYKEYKDYGSDTYKDGYDRYQAFLKDITNVTNNRGANIRVGLWSYSKDDLIASPIKIESAKAFKITDCSSTIIGEILPGENARVTYVDDSDGHLLVYNSNLVIPDTEIEEKICFQASDGDNENMIFDVNRPNSSYDQYRGKIKVQHSNTSDNNTQEGSARRIWVINELPLELYVWGLGEAGGGITEHTKTMIGAFRTYGRWYMEYATKWAAEGFHLLSNSGSQIYQGYDYEKDHTSIRELAQKTNGIIMKSGNNIALAAYGSWTDGKTRRYEDGHWGNTCETPTGTKSSVYPELSSVSDNYGKHPSLSTCELAANGNHMVGLSANGSLILARDHNWDWTKILNYYYTDINLVKEY